MKKQTAKIIFTVLESLVLLALGVLTIIYAKNHQYWSVIGYVSGALIILDGVIQLGICLFGNIVANAKLSLIRGISEVTLGIFILFIPEVVVRYFALLVSIAITVCGLMGIIDGIVSAARHSKKAGKLVLQFIGGAISIALGVVALCFYPINEQQASETNTISVLLIIIGVLFIISSLFAIGFMVGSIKKDRKEKDKLASEIADSREQEREKIKK